MGPQNSVLFFSIAGGIWWDLEVGENRMTILKHGGRLYGIEFGNAGVQEESQIGYL